MMYKYPCLIYYLLSIYVSKMRLIQYYVTLLLSLNWHIYIILWYGNGDQMHVILNGEPLEEVDCFKHLGSQVAADGGCERDVVHRMNEGYRAWGALKSVLSNGGLGPRSVYTKE